MRPTKLTPEVVTKLEYFWTLGSEILLSDEEICARIGLNYETLKKALYRDQKVTLEDGRRESIVHLRARARASLLIGYLQRHHALLLKADAAGEIANAHNILCWLEMKQLPTKFHVEPRAAQEGQGKTGYVEGPGTTKSPEEWERNNKPKPETPAPATTT